MRDVRAAADAGSPTARLAIDVHAHRLRREIAAMAAAMNGLDALVFTGGIGEHDHRRRHLGVVSARAHPGHHRPRGLEIARQVRTALGLAAPVPDSGP